MSSAFKKFSMILVVLGVLCGAMVFNAPDVSAGSPIVYNQRGSWVPMLHGTRDTAGVKQWLPNSSHFYMQCWTDDPKYYGGGNYSTPRWFFGQHKSGTFGWVHASFVYYQVTVRRC